MQKPQQKSDFALCLCLYSEMGPKLPKSITLLQHEAYVGP